MTYLQNREDALRKLRNQDVIDAENRQETRAIAAEGRAETRAKDTAKQAQQYKLEQLGVAADETRTTNAQKFSQDVQLVGIKANEDRKTDAFRNKLDANLATMKAGLDRANDEYSQQVKAAIDSGKVKDQITDANGRVILVLEGGKMVTTPFTAQDKVDTSNPYSGKPRKRGPTPGNFDPNDTPGSASSSQSSSSPWYSPGASGSGGGAKVATLAQVREAAKARGMSEAQVRKWMQSNGWSIE
ncbi:hypothetical protein [Sphingobium yanoikuyae]|uniref:hypothetical protein n=1 Tax=Sphingobium yanoikuyae TaxID=13690 RepID=UPI0035C771E6